MLQVASSRLLHGRRATYGMTMNSKAMEWALAQTSLSMVQKSVLVMLASRADNNMLVVRQSQQTIADLVGCSRSAANRALKILDARGRIGKVGIFDDKGGRLASGYLLNCAEEKMSKEIAGHRFLRCQPLRLAQARSHDA